MEKGEGEEVSLERRRRFCKRVLWDRAERVAPGLASLAHCVHLAGRSGSRIQCWQKAEAGFELTVRLSMSHSSFSFFLGAS